MKWGGSSALLNSGYKILLNREPLGDKAWHMFDIINDLGKQSISKRKNPTNFSTYLISANATLKSSV